VKKILLNLFAAAILAVVFAGCFSPVTIIPPDYEDTSSFTIDVRIGKNGSARSIVGPDVTKIKGNLCNVIQIIVVNEAGDITTFDEVRKSNDSELAAELTIDFIPFGATYYFLLLMGHWERDYAAEPADGTYVYKEDSPPTLLAAGLKEERIVGDGEITVMMWPIVVDTQFTTTDETVASKSRKKEPVVQDGKPETVELHAANWTVTWTIIRGNTNSGLTDLIQAQRIPPFPETGDTLLLRSKKTFLRGAGLSDKEQTYEAKTGNVITLGLGSYGAGEARKGKTGSVTFNLEYVPFNIRGTEKGNPWRQFNKKSAFDLSGANEPVWVIRNGVNDLASDSKTNFKTLGDGTSNGNGATVFKILNTGSVSIPVPW
jgi:hypothetical protein